MCVTRDQFKALVEGTLFGASSPPPIEEAADVASEGPEAPAAPPTSETVDADNVSTITPASVDGSGQQDEDAEEQEGSGSSQPPEHDELIVHGTAPAAVSPSDRQDNDPQPLGVPPAANDDSAEPLPATGMQ